MGVSERKICVIYIYIQISNINNSRLEISLANPEGSVSLAA